MRNLEPTVPERGFSVDRGVNTCHCTHGATTKQQQDVTKGRYEPIITNYGENTTAECALLQQVLDFGIRCIYMYIYFSHQT